jgi:hypothetical protein
MHLEVVLKTDFVGCKTCQIICYSEHLRAPRRSVLGLHAPELRVTNPVHNGKLSHVPRVPPHAPSPHGSGDHSCHVHVILMLCLMLYIMSSYHDVMYHMGRMQRHPVLTV